MSEPVLRAESIGAVRRLTMNRPAKLNALTRDLVERLSAALADAATDPGRPCRHPAGGGPSLLRGVRP
jgi:enoyl-CoA hydratase/carnithine racemase